VLGLLASLASCAEPAPEGGGELAANGLGTAEQSIVYGNDDRQDVYEDNAGAPSILRTIASTAIVALVPKARIQRPATGEVLLSTTTLGSAYQLCKGERFYEQPTAADCTGVLIDSDLVLTAGHCVQEIKCTDYHYVFDYYYRAQGTLESISSNDLFACRELVVQEISDRNGRQIDYAVIQLDRPAIGRTPIKVRGTVANEEETLAVIGTGSGLPIKIDRGGRAIDARASQRDYFELEADTFEGSSGSAIVDRDGALLGILVRGGDDYAMKEGQNCNVVNRLPRALPGSLASGDLAHEEATYAARALDGLCGHGFPSAALCTRAGTCGDDFCSTSETRASCPRDCDPCESGDCGARGDVRFTAGSSVKQSPGSGRAHAGSGCSLGFLPRAGSTLHALAALLLLTLFVQRRRGR
jgi:V8-like Glu-specific endopeptidase